MTKKYILLVVLNLLALIIYFNFSIFSKEKINQEGLLFLFKLAPADPRSIMQGDYMRLQYEITQIELSKIKGEASKKGYLIIERDTNGIGKLVRVQTEKLPRSENEYLLKYNNLDLIALRDTDNSNLSIGSESYFFEEGNAQQFEKAMYGGIKINTEGEGVLIGLFNQGLEQL